MKARELAAVAALLAASTGCSQEVSSKIAADHPAPSPCAGMVASGKQLAIPFTQMGSTFEEIEAKASLVVDAEVEDEKIILMVDDPDHPTPVPGEEALYQELVDGKAKIVQWKLRAVDWVKGSGPRRVVAWRGWGGEGIAFSSDDEVAFLIDDLQPGGQRYRMVLYRADGNDGRFGINTSRRIAC